MAIKVQWLKRKKSLGSDGNCTEFRSVGMSLAQCATHNCCLNYITCLEKNKKQTSILFLRRDHEFVLMGIRKNVFHNVQCLQKIYILLSSFLHLLWCYHQTVREINCFNGIFFSWGGGGGVRHYPCHPYIKRLFRKKPIWTNKWVVNMTISSLCDV